MRCFWVWYQTTWLATESPISVLKWWSLKKQKSFTISPSLNLCLIWTRAVWNSCLAFSGLISYFPACVLNRGWIPAGKFGAIGRRGGWESALSSHPSHEYISSLQVVDEMPRSRRKLECCHFFFILFLCPGKVHLTLIGVRLAFSSSSLEQKLFLPLLCLRRWSCVSSWLGCNGAF